MYQYLELLYLFDYQGIMRSENLKKSVASYGIS